ncbi:unnamed protein product [Phaeothamnion confervicola]
MRGEIRRHCPFPCSRPQPPYGVPHGGTLATQGSFWRPNRSAALKDCERRWHAVLHPADYLSSRTTYSTGAAVAAAVGRWRRPRRSESDGGSGGRGDRCSDDIDGGMEDAVIAAVPCHS